MSISWNDGQKKAIETPGSLIVSAAAGSGKTAVLVERIIRHLADENNPCNIDDFLVVTFTKDAASSMKKKISEQIRKRADCDPRFKKAQFRLPYANIGTIDSFCKNLVTENFKTIDISPDFEILEQSKGNLLKSRAINTVMDDFAKNRSEELTALNDMLNSGNTDENTEKFIRKLHEFSLKFEYPEDALDRIYAGFNDETPFAQTELCRKMKETAKSKLQSAVDVIDNIIPPLSEDEGYSGYLNYFTFLREFFESLRNDIDSKSQEEIKEIAEQYNFGRLPNCKIKGEFTTYCQAVKKNCKALFDEKILYFHITEDIYKHETEKLRPAVKTLIDAAKAFSEETMRLKKEANAYEFDDILHLALDLLIEKKDGKIVRTDLARDVSAKFKEIFVDEYQDVSRAQDRVFWAISNDDGNRFMVGDVKQSIYGFRNAMPQVFTELRENKSPYDVEPKRTEVTLNANYRSREEITDFINYIFSQIMTEAYGDVDYDEREQLNPEAKFEKNDDIKIEVDYFDIEDFSNKDYIKAQADFVAGEIYKAVNEQKFQVSDTNGGMRNVEYRDFSILLRGKKPVRNFIAALDNAGIPCSAAYDKNFLTEPEILFLISLLKVIDNPAKDIPLITVMLSPVFGFSADELAQMRAESGRGGNFCRCVFACRKSNVKIANFLGTLEKMRRIASTLPAGEYTEKIVDETGYRAIVSKMTEPEIRRDNINAFISLAKNYEKTGVKGIAGFVRFLDRINTDDITSKPSKTQTGNAVSITTIHGSKGLEYPVVILANAEKTYNIKDEQSGVILTKNAGLGMNYTENNLTYETVSHIVAKDEIKRENISEELRVLYVALTRAKERLIIVGSDGHNNNTFKKIGDMPSTSGKPKDDTAAQLNSHFANMLYALSHHPDADIIRKKLGTETDIKDCKAQVSFRLFEAPPEPVVITEKGEENAEKTAVDTELLKAVKDNLDYIYPYKALNDIRAKATASENSRTGFDKRDFLNVKPSFVQGGASGTEKGTATHKFMQLCDFSKAGKNLENETMRLVEEGILTQHESEIIDKKSIGGFFESDLFRRLLASGKIYREFSFNALMDAKDLYPGEVTQALGEEKIVMQGAVDLAFEENGNIILVDYKTDRVNSPSALVEEYSGQVNIYRRCLEKVLKKKVTQAFIYSFALAQTIPVDE